jgi:hypothetical protein
MQTQTAICLDPEEIIRKVSNTREARLLPAGAIVGDQHGGLTFTDAVATALESRSSSGWQEMRAPSGEVWTVIVVSR